MSRAVNIYDFDHTLYAGDASLDFIVYALKSQPSLWRYVPSMLIAAMYFLFGFFTRTQFKQRVFSFLESIDSIDHLLTKFWDRYEIKVVSWYKAQQKSSDIVISASPEFLLRPMIERLRISSLIATQMDERTGKIIGKNCRGMEKVKRLQQFDSQLAVEDFYSDSLSDRPLLALARRPLIVRGNRFIPYDQYRPSRMSAIKDLAFLRFLIVGGVNSFIGIFLSYIIALCIKAPLPAFIMGYSTSLIISYFLNAAVTFRDRNRSFKQFWRFCLSYIPNFLVLVLVVHILADLLHLYSLVSYILAAIIAAPVTFLLLSKFTFTKKGTQ